MAHELDTQTFCQVDQWLNFYNFECDNSNESPLETTDEDIDSHVGRRATNLPSGRDLLCDMVGGTPIESASFRSIRRLAGQKSEINDGRLEVWIFLIRL